MAKHAMLDSVPLTGSGRVVTERDVESGLLASTVDTSRVWIQSLDSGKVWVEAECSLEIVAGSVIFIQIGKRPAGQHVGVSTMLRIGYFLNSGYAFALGRRA
jgi:hypothetical protein